MSSPRIRSLKHTFFSDEKICEYPLAVRWTFAGLIAHADDEGRLKGDPRLVKAQVWPLDDDITAARVAEHLTRLASGPEPRIRWYKVAGRQYVEVINFKRHQYIQKPKPSELPAPLASDSDTVRVPDDYRLDGMGLDGNGADTDAKAPHPLASASTATATAKGPIDEPYPADPTPPPRVTLPPHAEKFVTELYGMPTVTPERRADVRRQLMDAIDPGKRGALLRRGVFVKTTPDRLERVCLAVRMEPPQVIDTSIFLVLRKLQDAETDGAGRTVTEAASHDARQAEAMEEAYARSAKSAANAWVATHRDEHEQIKRKLVAQFPGADTDPNGWQRTAYEAAHLSEVRKASGFPDFETWRATQDRASPNGRHLARAG